MITRDGASRMSSVFGLNASPQSAIVRPARSAPSRATILSTSTCFCASLTSSTAASTLSGRAVLARRVLQRLHVLRKAAAAVADARIQEVVADPRVGADALAHRLDVGAEPIGEVGELVHERDARRQHRVRRVLGELGRAHVHHQHALVVALERRVDGAHRGDRALVVGADDDAVGPHEIVDRRALLQELRVRHDRERRSSTPRVAAPRRSLRARGRRCPPAPWTCRR